MKSQPVRLARIGTYLTFLAISWWIYNSIQYEQIPHLFDKQDIHYQLTGYGLLFFFLSHLIILYIALRTSKNTKLMSVAGNIVLILGSVSFIALFFHWISLNEMEDDYRGGYSYSGMLKMLWTMQFTHVAFYLAAFFYFLRLSRSAQKPETQAGASNRQIFNSLHRIGILCGSSGMLSVIMLKEMTGNFNRVPWVFIVLFGFVLLPYLQTLTVWLVGYLKEQISGIRNPEITRRIHQAGLVSMIVLLPFMIGLTIKSFLNSTTIRHIYIDPSISVFWLPFLLFLAMLVFSVTTLLGRRNTRIDL